MNKFTVLNIFFKGFKETVVNRAFPLKGTSGIKRKHKQRPPPGPSPEKNIHGIKMLKLVIIKHIKNILTFIIPLAWEPRAAQVTKR